MEEELRLDFGRLGKAERTPQGGVRLPAFVTRVGVFVYKRQDGSEVRELRHPDEVFHPDSLATLEDAPVTDLHPEKLVNAENYKTLAVGHTRGGAARRDNFVETKLVVQDSTVVSAINAGSRSEVSCGYTCKIDPTAGKFEGERYDQVQRGIRYNHVALGPKGWGRAGNDVSLRLDGAAVQQMTDAPAAPKPRKNMKTIRIDGVDYEVGTDAHLQAQAKFDAQNSERIQTLTTERDTARSERDVVQGRLDEQTKELTAVKAEVAGEPARLDSLVGERMAVIAAALPHFGEDTKFDGKSNIEIMRETLLASDAEMKLDGKSDDYIRGRFESMPVPDGTAPERKDGLNKSRVATTKPTPAADADLKKRADAKAAAYDAWKQPLASSKDRPQTA